MRNILLLGAVLAAGLLHPSRSLAGSQPERSPELDRLIRLLLAPPVIKTQPGFSSRLVVAPGGQFYDTYYMHARGADEIWVSDDAGPTGNGQIVAVDRKGNTKVLVASSSVGDIIGFDVAPASFGKYGGHIFTLSAAGTESDGMYTEARIERFDPHSNFAGSVHCVLPPLASGAKATVPYFGVFGPEGSRFAKRFFVVLAGNHTIYEVTPDGSCSPFVTFSNPVLTPNYIVFTPDHASMLVAVSPGDLLSNRDKLVLRTGSSWGSVGLGVRPGMLKAVSPDGKVADEPYLTGSFSGPEFAPEGFGPYGGELFFTRKTGTAGFMPPLGKPAPASASVYRRTRDGRDELVAEGFVAPRIKFIDSETLWVSDHNADMVTGRREWPDGFIVEIKVQ